MNLAVALRLAARQLTGESPNVDAWFADYERLTFGGLASAVRKLQALPAESEMLIREALTKRNWLVHAFFKDHSEDMLSDEGRRLVIDELREMVILFKRADNASERISAPLWARFGVTREAIEAELLQLRSRNGIVSGD